MAAFALALFALAPRAWAQWPSGLPQPPLVLHEPPLPPPRDVREIGESPLYYRISPNIVGAALRLGIGMNVRLGLGGDTTKVGFTVDVLSGVSLRFGRRSRAGLLAEVGYSFVGFGEHLAQVGMGPLVRRLGPLTSGDDPRYGALALVPHFIVGSSRGSFALGERTGLLFTFWAYGIEVGHQVTFVGDHPTHEIHLTFAGAAFDMGGDG